MQGFDTNIKKQNAVYLQRHWIIGGIFVLFVVFNIFCMSYDLTILFLHPIRNFDCFIVFPVASILFAWIIRDKRKEKEVQFQILSGHLGDYSSETDRAPIKEKQQYSISESVHSINENSMFDSFMYLGGLLIGAYSTFCIAMAVIEKTCVG